jgi:hypothetical protein
MRTVSFTVIDIVQILTIRKHTLTISHSMDVGLEHANR